MPLSLDYSTDTARTNGREPRRAPLLPRHRGGCGGSNLSIWVTGGTLDGTRVFPALRDAQSELDTLLEPLEKQLSSKQDISEESDAEAADEPTLGEEERMRANIHGSPDTHPHGS